MTKQRNDSWASFLCRFREAFYLLLSRAFSREPDKEMLKNTQQVATALFDAWELMELPAPDIQEGKQLLERFFKDLSQKDTTEVIQELAREYASLFLGVGPKSVSLCESVYRSKLGLLCQSTLFEVQEAYREIGMAKNDEYREPDDHIAVELSYMARLCAMTREATEQKQTEGMQAIRYLALQKRFLEGHLLQWVPRLSQDLIGATSGGFYRAMAHLLRGFVGIDNTLIESMQEKVKETPRKATGRTSTTKKQPSTHQ